MLRQIILWRLNAAERELGVSVDYLRHLVRVSTRAFLKFARIMPMAQYRHTLPPEAVNIARLCGSRSADCGSCVQIAINTAVKEGVPREMVRAVLDRAPLTLPSALQDVYCFSEAVLAHDDAAAERWRGPVTSAFGDSGVAEIALALGSSLVFPTVKRTLGYSTSCANMTLAMGPEGKDS